MPEIKAFHGWRYNPSTSGDLSKVLAPPYDVISSHQQKKLYQASLFNVVRLELGVTEPGDSLSSNKYTRAAGDLRDWKNRSVILRENKPALYVYVQDYRQDGKRQRRLGFLSLMKIDEKVVKKHENTLAAPKEDRLKLLRGTRTNLSPIFGLFEDPKKIVNSFLQKSLKSAPVADVTIDGVRHRLFVETREDVISGISKAMKAKAVFIADGHHRFETACNYKKEACLAGKPGTGHEYVMTYFADCRHNPFKIFPTHRMIKTADPKSWSKLAKLGTFEKVAGLDALLARLDATREDVPGKPYDFGFYTKARGFYFFRMDKKTAARVKTFGPVDRLDVAVLHRVVIGPCFGVKKIEKSETIDFTRDAAEARKKVEQGLFDAAIFLRPTSLKEMIMVSKKGLKMPQKSTYFYPKLLSGLVFYSLD